MFRKLGDLIHRTSWFALIGGGLFVLVGLVLFAAPIHLLRLSETGRTDAERSAIKREITLAFGDRALTIAESVVKSMQARSGDPERIRDLNAALAEMERARRQIERARSDVGRATGAASAGAREAARAAAQAALDTAMQSAESAVEAATDAREAIEQARDDTLARLRDRGVDTASTRKSFEALLRGARENERNAIESLAAIKALPRRVEVPASKVLGPRPGVTRPGVTSPAASSPDATPPTVNPAPAPGGPVDPAALPAEPSSVPSSSADDPKEPSRPMIIIEDGRSKKRGMSIQFDTSDGKSPGIVLPPEVRRDIRNKVEGDVWRVGVGSAMILVYVPLFMMLMIAKYLIGRSRRALAFAEEKQQEAEVSDINRQITEARLRALQAQIEPHFLYNTLANVQALTEFDPPAANAMVGHLIQYLRAALPKMRQSTSTIGQEVELVRAYLNILKMRMGARLEFGIELPESLAPRPFPPMMLPSLVENAIKHGLEPVREGGRIDVIVTQVTVDGRERVRVEVRDTGRGISGLPPLAGGGVGLTNLRERLAALHGADARFTLEPNAPQGAIATIEVPLEAVSAATAFPDAMAGSRTGLATAASGTIGAMGTAGAIAYAGAGASTHRPLAAGQPEGKGWRRMWRATSRTHTVWASITSKLFFGLMFILAVAFALSLIALYTGWMPMIFGNQELHGIEGKALGSVVLLGGFLVAALAVTVVVGAFYGLGFVFAALIVVVPAAILVFLFPFLAPFLVLGLLVWWFVRRRRRRLAAASTAATTPGMATALDSAKISATPTTESTH